MAEGIERELRSMATFQVFEGLSTSDLECIFSSGVIRQFNEGEVIFRKNESGDEVFFILSGTVDIFDNLGKSVRNIAELGPGEILGEMALFETDHKRSVHAIAREPSKILTLGADTLKALIECDIPKGFLFNIIDLLCQRLRTINRRYMRAKYENDIRLKAESEMEKITEG